MESTASIEANQRWREQQGLRAGPDAVSMVSNRKHAANGRPGHTDAHARLEDMDADGVEASVELLRGQRVPLPVPVEERLEGVDARVQHARSRSSRRPTRSAWSSSYQIPIHDIDAAVAEVRWAASVGCKSLQLPVFPAELGLPDYWDSALRPAVGRDPGCRPPICLHIGLNTALDDLARRDPTPQKGIFVPMVPLSAAEAFGMWVMGGVFERFPRLEGRVRGARPRLGGVVALHRRRHRARGRATSSRRSRSCRATTSAATSSSPSSTSRTRSGTRTTALGIENIMWSSDYPHPVSSWPNSRALVEKMFARTFPTRPRARRQRQRRPGLEPLNARPPASAAADQGSVSISARTSPMIFVALCAGSSSPPSASATSWANASTDGLPPTST